MAQLNLVARTQTKHFPPRHIGKWGASRVPLQRCWRCRSGSHARSGIDVASSRRLVAQVCLTWATCRAQSAPGVQCNTVALEGSPQDLARCACLLTWAGGWRGWGAGGRGSKNVSFCLGAPSHLELQTGVLGLRFCYRNSLPGVSKAKLLVASVALRCWGCCRVRLTQTL